MRIDNVKRMDVAEFRREGYLQEVNRRFLHPLGLALEVVVEEDGSERLGGVWDCRGDAEGVYFAGDADTAAKAARVDALWAERGAARRAALGFVVQPADGGAS